MRIIHLSDIHFNMKEIKEIENFIINPLIADLKEKNEEKSIDAIFITGDLLLKGGEGKIDEGFENFNEKFIKVFEEELGVTKDKIFLIPGNHDIDRTIVNKYMESGLKHNLTTTNEVNSFIDKNNCEEINRILSFKKFEETFYSNYEKDKKQLSNFESNFIFYYQGKSIGISCLNTAWRCYGNDDSGNLILGERQITNSVSFLKDCYLKIALMHHSLDDLALFDKTDVSSYLKSKYDILFSGHSHTSDTFKTMTSSGELIVSIAPANWTHGIRSGLNNYYNGYAIIDINFDNNKVEIEHRKYFHEKKKYIPNNNLGNDYGKETFPLKNNANELIFSKKKIEIINKQNIPKPVSFFTGRKKELEELGNALLENSIVGLLGIGGTGKSTLASKYIESLEQTNNVSWFECLESSSLDSLIESIGYKDLLEVITKSPREKLINFIGVIERDEKIIFLDNFHSLGNRSFNEFLELFNEKSNKSKIILISRQKFENPNVNIKPIPVEGLNEDSIEYAKVIIKYKGWQNNLSDKELEEVCEQVKGHPLAITLALTLILEYGEEYKDIIKKLALGDENSEALSKRLLSYIFENDKIEKDEKEFLINFSVFEGEVDLKTVNSVLEKDSMMYLKNLRKNLIINLNNRKYELHPVIREFCYEKLKNKKELHGKVAEYYISLCDENRIDGTLEEKVFYNLIKAEEYERVRKLLLEKGEDLISSGYKELVFDIIGKSEEIKEYSDELDLIKAFGYDLIGEWNESEKFFDSCIENKNIPTKIMIRAKLGKFSIGIKKGQSVLLENEIEEFYDEFKNILEIKEKIDILNLLGLSKEHLGKYELALEKYLECLNISEEMKFTKNIATSLNNMSGIFRKQGKYELALKNYEKSLKKLEDLGDKSGIGTSLNNIGVVYKLRGNYELALEKFEKSLKIGEELGNKSGIATRLNNIGAVYESQEKYELALEKFEKSLIIAEDLGEKSGIETGLNNIGQVYKKQNKNRLALTNFEKSLEIAEKSGDKSGIGLCLNNIGGVYFALKNKELALSYIEKSLMIVREIRGAELSQGLFNASILYFELKKIEEAFELLVESYALAKKMGIINYSKYEQQLARYRKKIRFAELKEKLEVIIIKKLGIDLGQYVTVNELLPNQTREKAKNIGRNDPCTCGSGKKYKKCCGK